MSDNQCKLLLKYEGEALNNHSMDVAQLAPSLLALNEAIQTLNKLVNGDSTKVTLKIDAPIKSGSIGIDLSLVQDLFSQIADFLTSNGVSSACNAFTLISCIQEIIMLKKYLEGRNPAPFIESKDEKNTTLIIGGQQIIVNNITMVGLANPTCTAACSRLADPLRYDGVECFQLSTGKRAESVSKEELEAFQASAEERELTRSTRRVIVIVESPTFKDNTKWKVSLGDKNSFFVAITDENFLQAVNSGKELFGKGDYLVADLESVQSVDGEGKVKISHTLTNIYEHKHAMEQLELI